MTCWGNPAGDLGQMQVHRLGVAERQDQARGLAIFRADRAKDVGGGGALVLRGGRSGAALGPSPGDLVLLANAGLIGKPHLYPVGGDAFFLRDGLKLRREGFLKSSIAPGTCAW